MSLALLGLTVSQIEMELPPGPGTLAVFMLEEQQAALSRSGPHPLVSVNL